MPCSKIECSSSKLHKCDKSKCPVIMAFSRKLETYCFNCTHKVYETAQILNPEDTGYEFFLCKVMDHPEGKNAVCCRQPTGQLANNAKKWLTTTSNKNPCPCFIDR